MKHRVLPQAVSTTEFYLFALIEQVERMADGIDALTEAITAVSADGEMTGLDEERMITLLSSIKGIGEVTAQRIVDSYKESLDD